MTDAAAVKRPASGMPRGVLIAAGALIAFAIVGASATKLSGVGADRTPVARAVQTLSLRFEDQANGSVLVRNADDGAVIYTIAPETNGFMRATLRGLARERRRSGLGDEIPFVLTFWNDGRMSLDDSATGRRVALEAFGETNAGAFAKLFRAQGGVR